MAASLTPTLIDKDFSNWLKATLAVLFAREGLINFVENEIIDCQNDLLKCVSKPGTKCSSCTTANVLVCPTQGFCSKGNKCNAHDPNNFTSKSNQPCPHGLCNALRDAIRNEHRFHGPSWKNTDARGWCTDAYQIAKCYLPPDGYAEKSSLSETDFNGLIAIIINNKRFEKKMSTNFSNKINICEEARKAGREIRHSATHTISDNNLLSYIDVFLRLLSDPVYLVMDDKAKEAVDKLKQLKANTLTIHTDDITTVLNDSIKATFDDRQNALIYDIQEHFKVNKADSIEAIDRKIEEFVDRNLAKIKTQTEKERDDLISQTRQAKEEINASIKHGKEEGKKELDESIQKGKIELSALGLEGKKEIDAHVEIGKKELSIPVLVGKEELKAHVEIGKYEMNAQTDMGKYTIEETAKQKIGEIEVYGKKVLDEINRAAELNTGNNGDNLLKVLKEDLVAYYRENESMITVAPLVDEHDVLIEDFYVLPPMWAFDKPYNFGPGKNSQIGVTSSGNDGRKMKKISVSQLFHSDGVRYRKIYITANAGFGKTSLSQKLTMTWCQTHSPLESLTEKYEIAELNATKHFEFLFLLHLRDYQSEPKCNLDDLIMKMLSTCTSHKIQYTNEFIERILNEKECLIILDGLDEWAHPSVCRRKPEVPHNNHPDSCTVLTTTRDWKIGTIGLTPNHIDRCVEISKLDGNTRILLEKNAFQILNERNLNLAGKTIADFDKEIELLQTGGIVDIPYIRLQLMCLFFGGLPTGESKCEIYSNITEFTLKRGINKENLPDINVESNNNAAVPYCMKKNKKCNRYFSLIMLLGKLAFFALFSNKKESSLIFDRQNAKQFMTKHEIEFCLKAGLLCQTKDISIIAEKRYKVFFQCTSVQEFFAAVYITSEWQNENIKSTILKVCTSLQSTLELENMFVFVCGMNPEAYTCISGELQKIVDLDSRTYRFRTYMYTSVNDPVYNDSRRTMNSYQSMQVRCLQESLRNGNENCSIYLCDILIDKYNIPEDFLSTLKTIIHFNKGNMKSLQLTYKDKEIEIATFMQSMDPGVFTSLETLRVEDCHKEPAWLADILTESVHILKCLTLVGYSTLSDRSITALTGLTCLQLLYLGYVHMTKSNLRCLFAYISQTTSLTQLKLELIHCSDLKYKQNRDCDVALELHLLNELKILHLDGVTCRELHVNTACLETLKFRPREEMTTSASLWQDLREAPVLSSLTLYRMLSCQEMIQTIPTLTQLQYLKLQAIDMGDVIPRCSATMTKLKRVELQSITMSAYAWRELFLSIANVLRSVTLKLTLIKMTFQEWRELLLTVRGLPHPVTVELSLCKGPSREEWKAIVDEIKSITSLLLLQNFNIYDWGTASLTVKNIKGDGI